MDSWPQETQVYTFVGDAGGNYGGGGLGLLVSWIVDGDVWSKFHFHSLISCEIHDVFALF